MKKTLIALMALASVASAAVTSAPSVLDDPSDFGYLAYQGTGISLTTTTNVTTSDLSLPYGMNANVDGLLYANTVDQNGNNGSPGFAKVVLTLNLNSLDSTGNVFTLIGTGNNAVNDYRGWGISVGTAGALTFARVNADTTVKDNSLSLGTLVAGTTYTITIISDGTPDANGIVGRGTGNFDISVDDGNSVANFAANGFGFNGDHFDKFVIGKGTASGATAVDGVVSVAVYIPEPATATLSLLALAGLAARRRRK